MSNENLRRGEAAARAALVTVHSYDVSVDVTNAQDPQAATFASRSEIRFAAAEAGSSTFLDFIGPAVLGVELNGRALDPTDVVDGARIQLSGLQLENTVVVAAAAAYSRSGEGLHRFVDPADGKTYLYTQYEPADSRRVFANFEQPDLKAPFTFHVTAPSGWEVASNAVTASSTPAPGGTRWDFAATLPMSTYITTILAGPYFKATDHYHHDGYDLDVPLAAYCRASIAGHFDADAIFTVTKDGLDYFNELFDYPYPWGKYDQAFVPEYNLGAMENPGLVTFTENYVFTSRATDSQFQGRANTILHEMAHMWFGDLVTMTWWDDLWLKESFADYMGHLGVAEATEWGAKSWTLFAARRKSWAYVQDQLPTTHPIVADIKDLEAAKGNFDGITYAKGASVLKQLVAYVGFEAFTAGTREYFRTHEYSNTSLADLLAPLGAASGRDLGAWAQAWLQTSGPSTLTPEVQEADGVITTVLLRQDAVDPVTGLSALRPHRLKVGLYSFDDDGALVRTGQATTDVTGVLTEIDGLAGQPVPDLLLVNDEDLTYAKIRLDGRSQATALAGLDKLADPLARGLVFSALWGAVRDALLPASDYVEAVLRLAPAETDLVLLQTLVDNALYAVEHFCPATQREALAAAAAEAFAGFVDAAEAGSDTQLVWARALAQLGRRTDASLARIRALVDATAVPAGLVVDSALRWQLLQALASRGQAELAELDAALAADNTASARAGHTVASTARPLAQVKERAWEMAVVGTALSNELLGATIEGFMLGGSDLLAPYVGSYFDALDGIWAGRSIEIASRLVRGLYPATADLAPGQDPAGHPVVVRTDEWLAGHAQAPAGLRRIVLEQREHLLRALLAQEFGMAQQTANEGTVAVH
ncbi:aminopeptidase N [Arthrobacter sp. 35W]|uniref:aminopeptidase N n=1 Tax=Arthrobacter sp. 35W TaxID=1132441 RepID=UPI00041B67EE|nr:aminopeptidase N [Arthrobacter sp. 35W]